MNVKEYIQSWADSYKKDLTENIMPFWMEHGWDRENGGVYTCVNRDGSLMDSTKSVWFQGRFAFICAFAYNNVEKTRCGSTLPSQRSNSSRSTASTRRDTCISL